MSPMTSPVRRGLWRTMPMLWLMCVALVVVVLGQFVMI